MIDLRSFRLGIAPLFMFTFGLSRSDIGVHASISFHIYKFGVHVALSTIE